MQSTSQSVFFTFRIACAVLFLAAAFLANPARAQLAVAGYPANQAAGAAVVVAKGAGEAQVIITGVALRPNLSYCLIGMGRGNWYGSAVKVQLEKIGCAKVDGGKVIVPIRLEAKRYETNGAIIGYVPIGVDAAGLIKEWPAKPVGSVDFVRSNGQPDQAIAIRWTATGQAALMSAAEASNLISD